MHSDIECPFKDDCTNTLCTVKLYAKYKYYVCDMLKGIEYVMPNFFVVPAGYGNKIRLKCNNFKGPNIT